LGTVLQKMLLLLWLKSLRRKMSFFESELAKIKYNSKLHNSNSALRIKMRVKNRKKKDRVLN